MTTSKTPERPSLMTTASGSVSGVQHYIVCCAHRGIFLGMGQSGPVWSNSTEAAVMVTGAALCFTSMDEAATAIFRFNLLDRKNNLSTTFDAVRPDISDPQGKKYASIYACMRAGKKPWLTAWSPEMEMQLGLESGSIAYEQ